MTIKIKLDDGNGSGNQALVTNNGEIVTRDLHYSETFSEILGLDNTAVTIVIPRGGKFFVITGLLVNTNRFVSTNGAFVNIYESLDINSLIIRKPIISMSVNRNEIVPLIPLTINIQGGSYINATTSSDDVSIVVIGYFADSREPREGPLV